MGDRNTPYPTHQELKTPMKIKSIRAIEIEPRAKNPGTKPYQRQSLQPAGPLERYSRYRNTRSAGGAPWKTLACIAEAEDGTWGLGLTTAAGPILSIINDHFRPHLEGENAMAIERHFDVMTRLAAPYGAQGLPTMAISAVDLALWDLKGKVLQRPVYELLGGKQKDKIFCYATGFDLEWYLELGFKAVKLPMPYSPLDGIEGLKKAEEMVAQSRTIIGDEIELALDCWMALDVEYAVRLAEVLKPYRLKWIEDFLLPDDMDGFAEVRQRVPDQPLATGEHWYLPPTFAAAARNKLVDIFQPDLLWAGGLTACVQICHIAEANGLTVVPHGGMNWPYGQHLVAAMPAATWGERSGGGSPRGVPLADTVVLPGTVAIEDGYLVPSDAPGFGIDVDNAWLESVAV